jgi:DNA-binding NtrC family response regulator
LELLAAFRFDLAVIDIIMAKPDGPDVVRSRGQVVPILVITGGQDVAGGDTAAAAIHVGANRALAKPFCPSDFIWTIEEMLAAAQLARF